MSNQKLAGALRAIDAAERAGRAFTVEERDAMREALAEHDAQPTGFTVFLRQANNEGTTHISYHPGDRDEAVQLAIAQCHANWGWDGDDDDLRVLGVAAGDVTIVEWDDLT